MENNIFYDNTEKAESSEAVLNGCAVDDFVYYVTRFKREVSKYASLDNIRKHIFSIDFLLAYYRDSPDTCAYIMQLREDIANKKEVKEAKRALKELDPANEVKASIIIENLLKVCEKQESGIGIISGKVYYYNGCYWEVLEEDFVKNYLALIAEVSGVVHFQATKVKFMDLLYKQLFSEAGLPMPKETTDVKINLKNGTFKCHDGKFEICPFSIEDRLTYQLSFEYDPNAKAPKFLKFLDEVIPEKEARMVIAEYIAYIFAKHLRWEKCLVLLGSGANGKSVLLDIITALLGAHNVCHFSLSRLTDPNGYYRAELGKFLLNACSEIGIKNSESEMVKQLFSNDPVSARSPYETPINVYNYCRFLFCANCISNKDLEQSNGYFRKFMFLEFNPPVPAWKRNPNLAKEIIKEELSGVFNWVLEGLQRILQEDKRGFTYSAHIDRKTKEIEKNSNSVALFMDDFSYQPSSEKHMEAKSLYFEYKNYCEENRYGPASKQEFLRRLEEQLHFTVKRKATNNSTWVYCVKVLRSEEESDNSDIEIPDLVDSFVKKGIIKSHEE